MAEAQETTDEEVVRKLAEDLGISNFTRGKSLGELHGTLTMLGLTHHPHLRSLETYLLATFPDAESMWDAIPEEIKRRVFEILRKLEIH